METLTSIKKMLAGNNIFVPTYQFGYSWDTEIDSNKKPKQVNTFLSDLEESIKISTKSKYYLGHFLFKEKEVNKFGIIDGHQRLTTIVIFISALFFRLKQIRPLNENEQEIFEDTIKRNLKYRFSTVEADNQCFKDYVIDNIKKDKIEFETDSAIRIINAYNFFTQQLADKDELDILKMLNVVVNADCTTYSLSEENIALFLESACNINY